MADLIKVTYSGRIATITIDNDKKLNALNVDGYYALSRAMREVAQRDDVYITILTGKGRYFSAGADVSLGARSQQREAEAASDPNTDTYREWLRSFVANNLELTRTFYSHPKILVAALNGPAVGLSAAVTAFADFVYAAPGAFLLLPFSSLGLVAEGGASRALVQRLGVSLANEALIMSRRIACDELARVGFVNKVLDPAGAGAGAGSSAGGSGSGSGSGGGGDYSERFLALVLREVDDRLGSHLNGESLTGIKALLRRPEIEVLERQNVAEVFAGLDRFVKGVPQEEFRKIATGEKRHKL
ncbi:putative peroxisomal -enoyl- isomerase protein [Eutypa lata UCREL1]|uniref:Putative peroxisomal-enoyl-isomerase protein n=1 Tax=Eutypa lata (strain UCR-EL1) TaxID=1287681 RepID=M7SQE2_EUTLA|nr:putative peroxisomal -enoyl- isomerase protein [Eutypa lata UCREL1]